MLYYDKIYASEGIDINQTSKSKECDICHYWNFLDEGFKFRSYLWNGCYDLLMMCLEILLFQTC